MTDASWAPDSLELWRQYVNFDPPRPEVLSKKERQALGDLQRQQYDESRIAYINSAYLISTPDLTRLARVCQEMLMLGSGQQYAARPALGVSGSQTLGKTTAAMYLGQRHERRARLAPGLQQDMSIAPVIYVTTPSDSTPKGLMARFATTLGVPYASRDTAQDISDRVIETLRRLQTSMVILDEVQNLKTRGKAGGQAADALRGFTQRVAATFVFVGVDLRNSDFLRGESGAQFQGRITLYDMEPFSIGSENGRDEWLQVLRLFEREFPLADHRDSMLEPFAGELHSRTGGVLGSLRLLLRKAQIRAILDGQEKVDRRILESVSLDLRAETERRRRRSSAKPAKRASA